jgi:hypothetical protein
MLILIFDIMCILVEKVNENLVGNNIICVFIPWLLLCFPLSLL